MNATSRLSRTLAALVACAVLALPIALRSATPSTAQAAVAHTIDNLVGNWTNVDSSTRNVVAIDITGGITSTVAHAYGACSPSPCDWGAAVVGDEGSLGRAVFTFSFAVKNLFISRVGSQLRVITSVHFTDKSGRKDYRAVDMFQARSTRPQPSSPTVMWINHLAFLAGDPSVAVSYNAVNSGVGSGLSGLIITSSSTGDQAKDGGNKVVETGVQAPPSYIITGVRVCYELSNPRSYISQVRLAQVQNPPSSALVRLDDATALNASGPVCVTSAATSVDPSQGEVLLSLRVNFGDTSDRIVLRAVGLLLAPQ